MDPISKAFVSKMETSPGRKIPVVQFRKGERKDGIAAEHLKEFAKKEGVLFIGQSTGENAGVPHRMGAE